MLPITRPVWLLVLIVAGLAWYYLSLSRKIPKSLRSVPGPRGLPLLGNVLQLSSQPQREFKKWARQYGELFQVKLGWETWVFVNSPEAVKEILDKKSAITSGRPPMPVASDLISDSKRLLLMNYTPLWRKLRSIVHSLLTPKMSDTFRPLQELEAKQLLCDLLNDNADETRFYSHIRRYTTSVMMTSIYGRRIKHWVLATAVNKIATDSN